MDDSERFRTVKPRRNCEEVQKDLSKLGGGAAKGQKQNTLQSECKVMHVGARSQHFTIGFWVSEPSLAN